MKCFFHRKPTDSSASTGLTQSQVPRWKKKKKKNRKKRKRQIGGAANQQSGRLFIRLRPRENVEKKRGGACHTPFQFLTLKQMGVGVVAKKATHRSPTAPTVADRLPMARRARANWRCRVVTRFHFFRWMEQGGKGFCIAAREREPKSENRKPEEGNAHS